MYRRSRISPASVVAMLVVLACGHSNAQAPGGSSTPVAAPTPAFDLAAIHLHIPEPHEHNSIWSSPFDSHFKAENMTLMGLIHWAFNMPESRILGAPSWATSTSFNIDAEADSSVDTQMHSLGANEGTLQKQKMVQALLVDRFKLVTHTETRELPVYALIVAKGGPRLSAPEKDGSWLNHGRDHIEIEGFNNSVATLAEELSKEVGRDVIDKTGISGRHKITLTWAPDAGANPEASSAAADTGPSIFTALQEQLGLKLEPQKGPVAVLVIDHAEMPTQN
jgi:uncharacterized protein (TIGR03435 family)